MKPHDMSQWAAKAQEQRMDALGKANEIRLCRARTRRQLRERRITVGEALTRGCCQSMRVEDLLLAQMRWGPARVHKLLRWIEYRDQVVVAPYRLVGDLSGRQAEVLSAACEAKNVIAEASR